ncbi:BZ3500_MvSof-1268-A1-R1_Chr4-2g07032 [Microbotryum saponariae]|uniref:BZ3500_MvSof-1268-A1-R1_Chr4-2g07032 protein n=1 Tax=Microbotryum saponariae TaxID=289078 RepID=A0A2X0MWP2_9BASI|nr:BZ3500_MvSof-1268-A1-R1_Chr4-2g07032 [Microbotryum saponariae]SDA06697.1 BZ3501_MvSof-1269-A2-R1_Chr4-2g06743 [Microbotryum saponariae]
MIAADPCQTSSGGALPPVRRAHALRPRSLASLLIIVLGCISLARVPVTVLAAPTPSGCPNRASSVAVPPEYANAPRRRNPRSRRVQKRDTSVEGYSALVTFGASYTDNAHARAAKYLASIRTFAPYSNGRYSNGPVEVEYMVDPTVSPAMPVAAGVTKVKLIDCECGTSSPRGCLEADKYLKIITLEYHTDAFGGSVILNGLAGTEGTASAPGIVTQMSMYLNDLKTKTANVGSGRVLHYFNSGINPVEQIWYRSIRNGLSTSATQAARIAVTLSVNTYIAGIVKLVNDPTLASDVVTADYMVVGIPHLDTVPSFRFLVPSRFSNLDRQQALAQLSVLSQMYNFALQALVVQLRAAAGPTSRVWYYDLTALWQEMYKSPGSYGITVSPVTTPCYSKGKLCANPKSFLYFDTLHPVTSVHRMMAQNMNAELSNPQAVIA